MDLSITHIGTATMLLEIGALRLLSERAVGAAVASGARVTMLRADEHPVLGEAGGMIALLRY